MSKVQIINSTDYYNKWSAEEFDLYSRSKENYLKAIDQLILEVVPTEQTIIDIGSGSGTRINKLSSKLRPAKLLCVDSSEEMVKKCQKDQLPVVKYDISCGQLECHGKFDFAFCLWNVLGHIDSEKGRDLALKYIFGSLKLGGHLIIDVNNRYNIKNYGLKSVLKNVLFDKLGLSRGDFDLKLVGSSSVITRVHVFTKREMIKLLKKAGFKIEKIQYFNYATGEEEKESWSGQILVIARKL
jgi:SAM-dependent methyltransferase